MIKIIFLQKLVDSPTPINNEIDSLNSFNSWVASPTLINNGSILADFSDWSTFENEDFDFWKNLRIDLENKCYQSVGNY